jgi:tetratricopeptide (TPR) repeat protein
MVPLVVSLLVVSGLGVALRLSAERAAEEERRVADLERKLADVEEARKDSAPPPSQASSPAPGLRPFPFGDLTREELAALQREIQARTPELRGPAPAPHAWDQKDAAREALDALAGADRRDAAEGARLAAVEARLGPIVHPPPPPPPGADQPVESILDEFDDYLMLPPVGHPMFERMAAAELAHRGGAYRAHVHARIGDGRAAVAEANAVLDRTPFDWLAWAARGQAKEALLDLEGARRDFLVARAVAWEHPAWALLGLAEVAEAQGDRAKALELYRLVLAAAMPHGFGWREELEARVARLSGAPRPATAQPADAAGGAGGR